MRSWRRVSAWSGQDRRPQKPDRSVRHRYRVEPAGGGTLRQADSQTIGMLTDLVRRIGRPGRIFGRSANEGGGHSQGSRRDDPPTRGAALERFSQASSASPSLWVCRSRT
jgi:hypothetical protein